MSENVTGDAITKHHSKNLVFLTLYYRADYWKSQEKKYCDFCKCWIADNKPSREFHEKGRRHKENVEKRLRNVAKKSARDHLENERVESTLKHIESAALAAYQKDVANNADLTSIAINNKLEKDNLALSSGSKKVWHEAKTNEGRTYYWNTLTNESAWVPPKEGFLSLNEQKEHVNKEWLQQIKEIQKKNRVQEVLLEHEKKKDEEEERARLAREKLKERRVVDDIPPVTYAPLIPEGKNDPYGRWQTVKTETLVDLQLPQQQYFEAPIVATPEPIVKEFKEKVIESIGGSSTSFKKRKIGAGAKRNTRQRLDDD